MAINNISNSLVIPCIRKQTSLTEARLYWLCLQPVSMGRLPSDNPEDWSLFIKQDADISITDETRERIVQYMKENNTDALISEGRYFTLSSWLPEGCLHYCDPTPFKLRCPSFDGVICSDPGQYAF